MQAKIPPRRENPHLVITFGERRAIYEQAAVFFKQHGGRIPEGKFVPVRLRDLAVEIRSVIPEVARMRFVGNGGYENRPFRQIQFVNALPRGRLRCRQFFVYCAGVFYFFCALFYFGNLPRRLRFRLLEPCYHLFKPVRFQKRVDVGQGYVHAPQERYGAQGDHVVLAIKAVSGKFVPSVRGTKSRSVVMAQSLGRQSAEGCRLSYGKNFFHFLKFSLTFVLHKGLS